jgi:hypothetical protein
VTRFKRFGDSDRDKSQEALRAQREAAAFKALKKIVPADEYEQMVAEYQRGEREIRIEDGFVMTWFSPKSQ